MPNWKKVIISGSNALLSSITASNVPPGVGVENLIGLGNNGEFIQIPQGGLAGTADNDWFINNIIGALTSSKDVMITGSLSASGGGSFLNEGILLVSHSSTEIFVEGNITASGHISASGNLFANVSDSSNTNFKTVMYDTATGQFFRTGSYGGGGGGTVFPNAFVQIAVSGSNILSADPSDNLTIDNVDNNIEFTSIAAPEQLFIELADDISVSTVTASVAVSSSGDLFANLEENSSVSFKTVMYDATTGKFFRTGSYGGGGGAPPDAAGNDTEIQFNDGGTLGAESDFTYNKTANRLTIGPSNQGQIAISNFDSNQNNLFQLCGPSRAGSKDVFFVEKIDSSATGGAQNLYATFDRLKRNFGLFTPTNANDALTPTARLHVTDKGVNQGSFVSKMIMETTSARNILLLGHAADETSDTVHNFISFQIDSGADGGDEIGVIYYDPSGATLQGSGINPNFGTNSVFFTGFSLNQSDKKLKKHITDSKKGISDIMSMKVRDFRWKKSDKSTPKTTGFIAQELLETHPQLVRNVNDKLHISQTEMIPLLVKAIQDQQNEINELKKLIKNK